MYDVIIVPKNMLWKKNITARKVSKYGVISGPYFSCIQIEYRHLLCKSPYSMRIQENRDQK